MQAFRIGVHSAMATWLSLASLAAQQGAAAPAQSAKEHGKHEIRSEAEDDRTSRLTLELEHRDLREVVACIGRKANANIVMDAGIEAAVTIHLQDVHWRHALTLVAEQAGCAVSEAESGVLKVEQPPRVYFTFANTDIQKVIDTIAKISGANILVAPEVQGSISVRLKNIPWRDALDAAVKTLGCVVVEETRGILRVVPAANSQQELETATIQLRYVRPTAAMVPHIASEHARDLRDTMPLQAGKIHLTLLDTLQRMVTPAIGSLEYMHETNTIMVKDTRPVVESVRRTIQRIDTEPAQVQFDIRFVTTSNEDVLDFGDSPRGTGWQADIRDGQIPIRLPFQIGPGWGELIANPAGSGPFADVVGNDPAGTVIPDVVFGVLNCQQASAKLQLLKEDARSKIVQAPPIVALDHQTASIAVGETVRYSQARVDQAGSLLLALDAADESQENPCVQLLATPHIVPGTDKILLQVVPQRTALTGAGNSLIGPEGFDVFAVGGGGQTVSIALPRDASSALATTVLLHSGETAVLRLASKSESDTTTQLPLFGDFPLLGYLFENTPREEVTSTQLVFLTPQIIRSAEDMEQQGNQVLQERIQDHCSDLSKQR